jgi:secreted trypsin-like serine protease
MLGAFIATLLLATMVSGQSHPNINDGACGTRPLYNGPLGKVTNGNVSIPGDWGWQVEMLKNGRFACGGSLINQAWIISATHCSYPLGALTQYSFRLGVHLQNNAEEWTLQSTVSKLINNPSYQPAAYNNDISLHKLTVPVVSYTNEILPVCLPDGLTNTFEGLTGMVTGYGTTSSGGVLPGLLMEANMVVSTYAACTSWYTPSQIYWQSMICGGYVGDRVDTCQGDSGGPFVLLIGQKYNLIGITSWGRGCGDIGVYTRVTNFVSWVKTQIATN